MNKLLPHSLLAIILVSLLGLMAGGCAHTSGGELASAGANYISALTGGRGDLDDGQITDAAQCDSAPFVLSGKTGESAISAPNSVANPAQSTIQKREHGPQGGSSLAQAIGERSGAAVAMYRFGMSAFKHINHNRHSLLLRIRVLQI